jgi:hypothetical protein
MLLSEMFVDNKWKNKTETRGKKMRILKGFVMLMLAASLIGCSNQDDVSTKSSATEQTKTENTSTVKKQETPVKNEPKETEPAVEMKKVGQEGYGYINVPSDWVKFVDVETNTSFQISSRDSKQIISMNVFEDAGADANLETYANIVAANMEKNGAQDLKGAKVKLGNYEALQVYAAYPEGMFLVAWVFKAEDGKYRYISAEGPKEHIMDVVGYVEKDGWSIN